MASVGGDYYDFFEIDDQRVGILVADVSGHDQPAQAALVAAMIKIAFSVQKPNGQQQYEPHPGMASKWAARQQQRAG
ncbi:MAG: hypothetical protein H6631_09175 [Anaerolineaceae bacterium]|nr:hypothetical protein [Anaerolineaceae bacterium]